MELSSESSRAIVGDENETEVELMTEEQLCEENKSEKGDGDDKNIEQEVESVNKLVQYPSLSVNEVDMLERLSKNPNVAPKSQQRGEPDMSSEEKLDALKELYYSSPVQFLSKFSDYILPIDSICFDKFRNGGDYEVLFRLGEIEKSWRKETREKRLKNRRYEALKKLVETTDYFSEEEMQRRNPILYEQLVGRYHTDEERQAFIQQSWKSTSGSGTTSMPLTDLFLAHLERTSDGNGISCRRMAQETQQEEEDEADAEYDSEDSDYDMESAQPGPSKKHEKSPKQRPTVNDEPQRIEIEDEEKELFKEEFFTTMYRNFLNGKDEDFDYATVDDNPDYDCGENLDNDEEEKYFDDEEPCEVSEPSSDQDDQFKPPVRSSEIESKIEKLSVNNGTTTIKETISESSTAMSEDEDELDVYMREIEKQLNT